MQLQVAKATLGGPGFFELGGVLRRRPQAQLGMCFAHSLGLAVPGQFGKHTVDLEQPPLVYRADTRRHRPQLKRLGKTLLAASELRIDRPQFGGARRHALLEGSVKKPEFGFSRYVLADIDHDGYGGPRLSVVGIERGDAGVRPETAAVFTQVTFFKLERSVFRPHPAQQLEVFGQVVRVGDVL